MNPLLLLIILAALITPLQGRAEKTRLDTESYVENSDTDFTLLAEDVTTDKQARRLRVFHLPNLQQGSYTVLVFVDGKFFRRESLRLPGRYPLSIRGLSAGSHRVTLQVVAADGRVGRVTRQVEVSETRSK